jgi:hypothetical protein
VSYIDFISKQYPEYYKTLFWKFLIFIN